MITSPCLFLCLTLTIFCLFVLRLQFALFPCSSWLMAQTMLEKIQPLTPPPMQSEPSSSLSLQRENETEKETAELTEGLRPVSLHSHTLTLLFCGHDNLFMLYVLPPASLAFCFAVLFRVTWFVLQETLFHDVIILYTPI